MFSAIRSITLEDGNSRLSGPRLGALMLQLVSWYVAAALMFGPLPTMGWKCPLADILCNLRVLPNRKEKKDSFGILQPFPLARQTAWGDQLRAFAASRFACGKPKVSLAKGMLGSGAGASAPA